MSKIVGHMTANLLSLQSILLHTNGNSFCSDFGGWGESTINLLVKINQYLCNLTIRECSLLLLYEIHESILQITPSLEKNNGKSPCYGLSKILRNCMFERSLFTLRSNAGHRMTKHCDDCVPKISKAKCFERNLPGESKKHPVFEMLLLPECVCNDILQYLIE